MEKCSNDTDASTCNGSIASSKEIEVKPRSLHNQRNRRPDKAVYVPRALRNAQSLEFSSSSNSPNLSVFEESDPPNHTPATDVSDRAAIEQNVLTAETNPPDWDQTVTSFRGLSLEDGSNKCDVQTKSLYQDVVEADDLYFEVLV